jgi:hypothetical protein
MRSTLALALLAFSSSPLHPALADDVQSPAQQLVRLKSLAGTWTGKAGLGGAAQENARRSSGPDAIAFDFVRGTNMKPGDMHMHSARISFVGPDRLDTEWTSWQGGKPAGTMRFELTRQK